MDGEGGEGHGFRIRRGLEVLSSRQDMRYRVTFTFSVFSDSRDFFLHKEYRRVYTRRG